MKNEQWTTLKNTSFSFLPSRAKDSLRALETVAFGDGRES